MTRPALWTKHRPIALGIAADYRIPGMDPDDTRQEALIALWEATSTFDRARGSFPAWARTVIHGHLVDLLREANRDKRRALNQATCLQLELLPGKDDVHDTVVTRERLNEGVAAGAAIVARRARWRETKRKQRAA